MKRIFEWLDGKKRIISLSILIVNAGLRAFAGDLLTPEQFAFIDFAGSSIGGYAMYDAYKKGRLTNRLPNEGNVK